MNCKDVLRREMIEKRKRLDLKNGGEFVKRIRNLECYKRAECVMLYMPIKGEADVTGILDDEKTFALPVTQGEDMYSVPYFGDLTEGRFGVPEPMLKTELEKRKIDMVIVPGVAFDKKFNRMGFGKGYYDRFLKDMECVKVGVCHSFQMQEELPWEEHDVKMDIIVTEDNVWIRENI